MHFAYNPKSDNHPKISSNSWRNWHNNVKWNNEHSQHIYSTSSL